MSLRRRVWTIWIAMGTMAILVRPVAAQPPSPRAQKSRAQDENGSKQPAPAAGNVPSQAQEQPWEVGVPSERRALARALYAEGSELLMKKEYRGAAGKYREALTHWNHPRIHYILALVLIELNETLAAYENITQALRYGKKGLDDDENEYTEAVNYEKLLDRQLAKITIQCDQAQSDAVVTLSGNKVLTCPGTITRRLLPGQHVIQATKPGYVDSTDSVLLLPGKPETRVIRLYTNAELTRETRRWRAWIPWTVAGMGMATGAFGLAIHSQASDSFRSFDRMIADQCPDGCLDGSPESPVDQLQKARWQQRIAVGSYAVGSAILAVGAAMVYLNWPRLERIDPNDRVTVTPYITSGSAGLVVGF